MARIRRAGVSLYYETAGSGEVVVFVNGVGYGAWVWGWQQPEVAGPLTALVADNRGTGRSDAPPGPYDVSTLAGDLEAVLSDHGSRRVHLVGAGLGGAVALRYAREYQRVRSLALFAAAADGDRVDGEALEGLFAPPDDPAALRASLSGALSPSFREARPDILDRIVDWRAEDDADRQGFEAQAAAWRAFESGPLYELTVPTLVVHGTGDPVVPLAAGRELAADLPRGEFVAVEGRHLALVEQSRAVTDRLLGFLEDHAGSDG
ncbi:MAG: alpha/beta fold hydrolase [Salinirussus sp.]